MILQSRKDNLNLREDYNIHYNLLVPFEKEMLNSESFLTIQIGKRSIKIPVNKLFIKQEQTYDLKGQGIPKIVEDDVYNVSSKGDIIITIRFQ